ncbi:MAG: TlpA disulfide reductase family protein [Bacteroidota bacterium]
MKVHHIQRRTLFGVLGVLHVVLSVTLSAQTVETITKESLRTLVAQRQGKILLLNIWATWCKPCAEEFPDLIRLSQEMKNVEVVALSADYPDEIEEKILPFIKRLNIPFKTYVADFNSQDELFQLLDNQWGGEIPATFVYNSQGRQTAFLRGKHSYDEFKKVIEETTTKR